MKSKWIKLLVVAFFVSAMTVFCAFECFALFTMTGHYDPDGTTTTYYAYDPSECNRTINVSMYDLDGNFLKKVVLKTKYGEDNSFHLGLGGYDIVNFTSDQGLWESCQMVWTSGTGLCKETDLFINYKFITGLSAKTINVTVEMRKWDPIKIYAKHYIETNPNYNHFRKDTYRLYQTDQEQTVEYYSSFYTQKINITGYTLRSEYSSAVSANFCYHSLIGAHENCPSSCYSYDLHQTDWSDGMDTWSTYTESKDGKIDWCDNREFWVEYYYDLNEYTIKYNANGGTGAPDAQTKHYGYDLTISDTIPTRSGYTFKGWGTYSSDTSVNYEPGSTYTSNASRTLYAIWESNTPTTYTVNYNGNGGTGAPMTQTKTHGISLVLSTVRPYRNGYTFKGWATSSSAASASYAPGSSYTSNSNITLYAVWEINTYDVTYYANGGSGAPSAQTKTHGSSLTLSTVRPSRAGYSFKGWATSASAATGEYMPGDSYTANASVSLYAVWKINTYTVEYDSNYGTGAPESQTKNHGEALTLSSSRPIRIGHTFKGWGLYSNSQTVVYSPGDEYTNDESITLYAVWQTNKYTIDYDANGGSGAPAAQIKSHGISITLSSTVPTRTGYSFLGWSTSRTATTASYQPGERYSANSTRTLYAVWEIDTYTISYDGNGGTNVPSSQTKTYDADLVLSSTTPKKIGYDFGGWATSSDGAPIYDPGDTYIPNESVTLYAVWYEKTYMVIYSANGGSGAPSSQLKQYNEPLTLSSSIPTRAGYTFLGWATSTTASQADYAAGSTYENNASLWLYAVWKAKTYTVTFDANGGSGAPDPQTKTYGVTLVLPETKPTKAGHTFVGWATTSNATQATYQAGGSFSTNGNLTLYAVWSIKTYTVSFDANGGTGAPSDQTKTYGSTLTLSTAKPTRVGYTFLGWATDDTADNADYAAGGSYTKNADLTLYAVWEINTFTVSYNANGGVGTPAEQTKVYDVALTLSTQKPTRTGYTFRGWSTDSSADSATYVAGGSYTANASATLYAVWEINTFTVSFDANGGTGAPSNQTKTYGVTLTLSSTKPTRTGYTFKGWATDDSADSIDYAAGAAYTKNADLSLYAVWEIKTYTVTFDANGGSGAPAAQTKTYGVDLSLSSGKPTRTGYTFQGWATSDSASEATYSSGGSYRANADLKLYAVWKINVYTVSYSANGGAGAPSAQTKTHGTSLTIPETRPTKSGYDFRGWASSSTASEAQYAPGDTYAADSSVTLYAVWTKTNYDFSISNLTVSDNKPYKYSAITITVRADSWDKINSYQNIPVELYYDGVLMATEYVDFVAYGVANITFTLNVGGSIGNKNIEARVNWTDHDNETTTDNNAQTLVILVKEYDYEMSVGTVIPSEKYTAGSTVITTFKINNDSSHDIVPSHRNVAGFSAYYFDGERKVVVSTQEWKNVVIPAGEANIVYFKWTVPSGLAGETVYCECTINADSALNEENRDNNTVEYSAVIAEGGQYSQTENTRYESTVPNSYKDLSAPTSSTEKATWNMWAYESGEFVLKKYGVQISSVTPVVTPSADCQSAVCENGKWIMRSGYGFTISYVPTISTASGYATPERNAYTAVQYACATFPEFNYEETAGNCRTLVCIDGEYMFVENGDSVNGERVHYIPVWVEDGNYTVSVIATEVWTPAGKISAVRNANVLVIDGTIYDDYYVGN